MPQDPEYKIIALLRGINVGGKNILPMKELAAILESLGYKEVQTYIQSGNAVFTGAGKPGKTEAAEICAEILKRKGFEPKLLLMGADQFEKTIDNNPYPVDNGKALHFFFLESKPENPDNGKLESLKKESEEYSLVNDVFYLYAPEGVGRSKLAAAAERALGVSATARNWNTVCELARMADISLG